jgi:DNA-binding beta-propeller fold protein YncE
VWAYDVVVNPLTNKIYVGSGDGWSVTVIDGATNATTDISAGIWQPAFLAVNTVTNMIYAAGAQAGGGVMVIDGATNAATAVATPPGPWGFNSLACIKINEVTNRVYVADSSSRNVLVIDGVTNELTLRPLDAEPCAAAVDTSVNRVYLAHCGSTRISILTE